MSRKSAVAPRAFSGERAGSAVRRVLAGSLLDEQHGASPAPAGAPDNAAKATRRFQAVTKATHKEIMWGPPLQVACF